MKKLNIDYIKKQFKKENYILLTSEYKDSKQKLYYICPHGHRHKISWNEWHSHGNRCPYCAGNGKPDIGFIKNSFKKEKFILLSNTYKNNSTKLKYICPNGHTHQIRWNDWKRGVRCPYCSSKIKKTLKFIRSEFEQEGYKLLSKHYKNSFQKLNYTCLYNHKHSITWAAWSQGRRCPTCKSISLSGENSPHWNGGVSCAPYCDAWADKEYKESIKQRDGYSCLNPYCNKKSKRLSIHHIDYDKENCNPNNLITLCASCNSKANKYRSWHIDWYRIIMCKRYNYRYDPIN